jgi:quinol monooxygenase YgiN
MSDPRVTLIVNVMAKPGAEDRLGAALTALVPLTRKEEGCIQYAVHTAKDNPAQFVIYESWRSQTALDVHLAMPYMKEFMATVPDLVAGQPTPVMLQDLT